MRKLSNNSYFNLFKNPNKETSYLMGFIWGDGYINKNYNSICIEFLQKDFENINHIFYNTGKWSIRQRNRKNRQQQASLYLGDYQLKNLLFSLDYDKKSYFSHEKAISYIPDEFKHYWLRGYFDADGCIYINKNLRQICFSSSYNQDWSFLNNFLLNYNIQCSSSQQIHKKNKSSRIRACSRNSCYNFFHYLYPNGYDFGLKRKYDKFMLLK